MGIWKDRSVIYKDRDDYKEIRWRWKLGVYFWLRIFELFVGKLSENVLFGVRLIYLVFRGKV